MEERLAYLVTSLESIFRKCHVTKFMTACKNHLYPQLNLQLMPGQKKKMQFTHALMFHILNRCVEMVLRNVCSKHQHLIKIFQANLEI